MSTDMSPDVRADAIGEVEAVLGRMAEVLDVARPVPMSASVLVHREELLGLLADALSRLPDEVREARRLLRDRESFLASVEREADDLLAEARGRAERMVQRAEVVRAAQAEARRTVEVAEREARRLRHEADEWCDAKLAEFSVVLERTRRGVDAGRARLGVAVRPAAPAPAEPLDPAADVFDQDGA